MFETIKYLKQSSKHVSNLRASNVVSSFPRGGLCIGQCALHGGHGVDKDGLLSPGVALQLTGSDMAGEDGQRLHLSLG